MIGVVQSWPPSVWPPLIGLAAAALVWPLNKLWAWIDPKRVDRLHEQGWEEARSLRDEVRALRVLLDKGRRRESAKDAVIDLLLLGYEVQDEEDRRRIFARASEILKRLLAQGASA